MDHHKSAVTPSTVAQALTDARARGLDKLDAELLLLCARGIDAHGLDAARSWLVAHDTDALPPEVLTRYGSLVLRRCGGEPLAYLTGGKEFFGLALEVDPRVLVPRPDTETLVDWTLELLDAAGPARRLLDLGTGSGAIALALAHARPTWTIEAVDASAAALAVAAANANRLQLPVRLRHGDWFAPVAGHFDAIVSNPPYVAAADPHLPALAHEPIAALVSGPDGLHDIRRIVAQAPGHLVAGGYLLLEHGYDQGAQVQALLQAAGFDTLMPRHDLAGHWRCTGGRWPAASP
jgi:release factor glutamine methyltransferase